MDGFIRQRVERYCELVGVSKESLRDVSAPALDGSKLSPESGEQRPPRPLCRKQSHGYPICCQGVSMGSVLGDKLVGSAHGERAPDTWREDRKLHRMHEEHCRGRHVVLQQKAYSLEPRCGFLDAGFTGPF